MPEPDEEKVQPILPTLRVYVLQHCPICREALLIVQNVRRRFSGLRVQVIHLDVEPEENIAGVFSVPTYVLDGRTISLGNPDPAVLDRELNEALDRVRRREE